MTALAALKRTSELSDLQIEAWHAVLSGFKIETINAAIIELVLTEVRFPELGDLYTICRRSLPKSYAPLGHGKENERPSKAEVRAVAERLGMKVD